MSAAPLSKIDLNLLVVLDVLLREKSVARTADRLNLTSSAVSHALKRLRVLFGNELLVRDGRRMVPTARAESLRSSAFKQNLSSCRAGFHYVFASVFAQSGFRRSSGRQGGIGGILSDGDFGHEPRAI
jgi:hypothetical protein